MKLFQFAVIKHPTEAEKKKGTRSVLVVDVKTILARDENEAMLKAARAIPKEHEKHLDRLEVAVRPF